MDEFVLVGVRCLAAKCVSVGNTGGNECVKEAYSTHEQWRGKKVKRAVGLFDIRQTRV